MSAEMIVRGRNKKTVLYRQLFNILRDDIVGGRWQPGERLPTTDELVDAFRLNRATVRRAIAELKSENLVYSIPTKGIYVSIDVPHERENPASQVTIGLASNVMPPGRTGPYHMELVEALRSCLASMKANLVLLPIYGITPQTGMIDVIMDSAVDAMIYIGPFETSVLRHMLGRGPKAVLIDAPLNGFRAHAITADNHGGGFQAMDHLLDLGHKQIAVVTGPEYDPVVGDRLRGVERALNEHGIGRDAVRFVESDFRLDGGYNATVDLLKHGGGPTAIFYFNDEMAAGGMQAAQKEFGLNVPEDISIIGFDDVALARSIHPQLTTVRIPTDRIAARAAACLEEMLAGTDREPVCVTVPTTLVRRESAGVCRKGAGR